jgi:hypothetical protein
LILIILGENASVVESTDRTTQPKVDKADTSSVEAPMAQALVARSGKKASDDVELIEKLQL